MNNALSSIISASHAVKPIPRQRCRAVFRFIVRPGFPSSLDSVALRGLAIQRRVRLRAHGLELRYYLIKLRA